MAEQMTMMVREVADSLWSQKKIDGFMKMSDSDPMIFTYYFRSIYGAKFSIEAAD